MLLTILVFYIGFGLGWAFYRDEFYDIADFFFEVIAWPFTLFEPVFEFIFVDGFDWLVDAFDDILDIAGEQLESIVDWFIDNTIGRFDGSRDNSVTIQSRGDLDIHEDFDGYINIQAGGDVKVNGKSIQSRDRSQRKNKKSPEIVDLQRNPLD